VEAGGDVLDDRIPTGFAFVIRFIRTYSADGVYSIRATVGSAAAEYRYAVRVQTPTAAPPAVAPVQSAGPNAKKSKATRSSTFRRR
jgi:hypothetical protein